MTPTRYPSRNLGDDIDATYEWIGVCTPGDGLGLTTLAKDLSAAYINPDDLDIGDPSHETNRQAIKDQDFWKQLLELERRGMIYRTRDIIDEFRFHIVNWKQTPKPPTPLQ